VKMVLNAGLQ